MTWKLINGNRYYYHNQKVSGRVVSTYHGSGWLAELQAEHDQLARLQRAAEQAREQQARARVLDLDHEINQGLDDCSALAQAALILAGYHRHKGSEWRRKSDNSDHHSG